MSALDQYIATAMTRIPSKDLIEATKLAGSQVDLVKLRESVRRHAELAEHLVRCIKHGPSLDYFLLQGITVAPMMADIEPDASQAADIVASIVSDLCNEQRAGQERSWTQLASYWCASGFSRIRVGHRLAASLMCTAMPAEHRERLRYPWAAFVVDVPDGLIPAVDAMDEFAYVKDGSYGHLLVTRLENGDCHIIALRSDGLAREGLLVIRASSIGSLVDETERQHPVAHMIARYVVGVVAELERSGSVTSGPRGAMSAGRIATAPRIQTYELTRDVAVDCREYVRRASRGGSLPTVQVLVRGHWRNQVCGKGRADRKWIHIEPFWRGPESGSIAVRSHKVSP